MLLIASALLIATTLQFEKAFTNPPGFIGYNDNTDGQNSVQENLLGQFGFKQSSGGIIWRDGVRQIMKYSDKLAAGVSFSCSLQ